MTPARLAREAACISLREAAIQARVTPGYLRAIEQEGSRGRTCSLQLALRLARIYRCKAEIFITRGSQTPTGIHKGNRPAEAQ